MTRRWLDTTALLLGCLVMLALTSACAAPINPSFDLSLADARADLRRMKHEPVVPQRPIIIATGYADPGYVPFLLGRCLRSVTSEEAPIVRASFFFRFNFDACRDVLVRAVEREHPSDCPEWTVEVDVIGYSMGGLVARYAALPRSDGGKRLRIARLFTISTPHQGARLAVIPSLEPRVRDMRAGSTFLRKLDEGLTAGEYELYSYVTLGDFIVGSHRSAPAGDYAWWVPTRFPLPAHFSAWFDPRIVSDIARRLRGEEPFATHPAAPLP